MSATTMLSACGGFVTRRNSQIQAKYTKKSSQSCSNRLQDQPQATTTTLTTATETTTTTTVAATCSRLSAHQPYSLLSCGNSSWLVIAVLVTILISSTAALPRRVSGRHLILPHRHSVHQRSAGQEHHEHHEHRELREVHYPKFNITKMNATKESLTEALEVCNQTRSITKDLLNSFLGKKNLSTDSAEDRYSYHEIVLEYPLRDEVRNKDYDGSDTQEIEEELTKILQSLMAMHPLLTLVERNLPLTIREGRIVEKLLHNKSVAESLLNIQNQPDIMAVPAQTHAFIEFGAINEFIGLLRVISVKYDRMLQRME